MPYLSDFFWCKQKLRQIIVYRVRNGQKDLHQECLRSSVFIVHNFQLSEEKSPKCCKMACACVCPNVARAWYYSLVTRQMVELLDYSLTSKKLKTATIGKTLQRKSSVFVLPSECNFNILLHFIRRLSECKGKAIDLSLPWSLWSDHKIFRDTVWPDSLHLNCTRGKLQQQVTATTGLTLYSFLEKYSSIVFAVIKENT